METSCSLIDILSSGSCFDFWLNRYQTLITGFAALIATAFAIRYARNQVSIAERQVTIMANQEKQTKAIATVKVDEALRTIELEHHSVLSKMLSSGDNWGMQDASTFSLPSPIDDLTSAAALAFPERALDLSDAFHAAIDLSDAYADFNRQPWHIDAVLNALDISDEAKNEQRQRRQQGGEVARRFVGAWAKVADMSPGARAT